MTNISTNLTQTDTTITIQIKNNTSLYTKRIRWTLRINTIGWTITIIINTIITNLGSTRIYLSIIIITIQLRISTSTWSRITITIPIIVNTNRRSTITRNSTNISTTSTTSTSNRIQRHPLTPIISNNRINKISTLINIASTERITSSITSITPNHIISNFTKNRTISSPMSRSIPPKKIILNNSWNIIRTTKISHMTSGISIPDKSIMLNK